MYQYHKPYQTALQTSSSQIPNKRQKIRSSKPNVEIEVGKGLHKSAPDHTLSSDSDTTFIGAETNTRLTIPTGGTQSPLSGSRGSRPCDHELQPDTLGIVALGVVPSRIEVKEEQAGVADFGPPGDNIGDLRGLIRVFPSALFPPPLSPEPLPRKLGFFPLHLLFRNPTLHTAPFLARLESGNCTTCASRPA